MKKLGLSASFAIYVLAAILMFIQTHYTIPFMSRESGIETIFFWFIIGGIGIFTPLILTGILILKAEKISFSRKTIIDRLRFRKLTLKEILLSIAGLIVVGTLSVLLMRGMEILIGKFDHSPSFMAFEPLSKGRYWLLLVWFPYWILNIMGEEFLWRGVMLPRQEIAFGKFTWFVHGTGWAIFHLAFGWYLVITLLPLMYIQSYLVQKTKNSWVGVLMHGGLNGPSFIAICFGLI